MRITTFKSVFDGVVRRLGYDPLKPVPSDIQRQVTEHINERISSAWNYWDWPDIAVTQERAFRPIWSATRQFKRSGDDGTPDEFFYLGDSFVAGGNFGANYGYYVVNTSAVTDPPIGTLPTNTTYFTPMSIVDTYISKTQTCRRTMGMVLGVYASNPRLNGSTREGLLSYRTSEKGIDVFDIGGPTVFVHYQLPVSVFTILPWMNGKSYVEGNSVFFPQTGQCYLNIQATNNQPPTNPAFWTLIPFPDIFANYCKTGAYADCLIDWKEGEAADVSQGKLLRAQKLENDAEEWLISEAQILQIEGQKHYYGYHLRTFHGPGFGIVQSGVWPGGTVTTLTDECEQDFVFTVPPPPLQQGLFYYPNVVSLKTTAPNLVATVPTTGFGVGTMIVIKTGDMFRLDSGAADNTDPGQGVPYDYSLSTNDRHWTQVR